MKLSLGTKLMHALGPVGVKLAKKSPIIFGVVGGIAMGAGIFLACKNTYEKLDDAVDDVRDRLDEVRHPEETVNEKGERVSLEPDGKDILKAYGFAVVRIGRVYVVPATLIFGGSICIAKGYSILLKTNASLASAYAVLESQYNRYRDSVRNELGDEKDMHFAYGTKKSVKVKENVDIDGVNIQTDGSYPLYEGDKRYSMYARIFDAGNPNWKGVSTYNELFLQSAQNYFNNLLYTRRSGIVTLAEVYDYFDFPYEDYGLTLGWIKNGDGNGVVDFGLHSVANRFGDEDGYHINYILDFNCKGLYQGYRNEKIFERNVPNKKEVA